MLRILLAKIETKNGKITPIHTVNADFKVQQVCNVTADLETGEYILFAKIGNNSKPKH